MNWIKEIDEITEKFIDSFSGLTPEEINWKPEPETWSIAQIIDHLIIFNETYFPVLENLKKGKNEIPFFSRFGFISSFFGKHILKSVSIENNSKTKTFKIWKPEKTEISQDIVLALQKHQQKLKEYIEESSGFIENTTIISSPANRHITYKLETAFDIIVTHEKRHFNQAKELVVLMNKIPSIHQTLENR